jgi:hypothetical protein
MMQAWTASVLRELERIVRKSGDETTLFFLGLPADEMLGSSTHEGQQHGCVLGRGNCLSSDAYQVTAQKT